MIFHILFFTGCFEFTPKTEEPRLVVDPPSALEGTNRVSVQISADGVDFSQCTDNTPASLTFFGKEDNEIDVHVNSLEIKNSSTLVAELQIDMGVVSTDHELTFFCKSGLVLHGLFKIRKRISEESLSLSIEPGSANVGDIVDVVISGKNEDLFFEQDVSHIVFDGDIWVKNYSIENNGTEIKAAINIPLTVSPGMVDVAVLTGAVVARGQFEVTTARHPRIIVMQDDVKKPSNNYWLRIIGENTHFAVNTAKQENTVSALQQSGIEVRQSETVVSFPQNPGIEVLKGSTKVLSPRYIETNIKVGSDAILGPTALVVKTIVSGQVKEEAAASFSVFPNDVQPDISVYPKSLLRGSPRTWLVVNTENFQFGPDFKAVFQDEHSKVLNAHFQASDTYLLEVSISKSFEKDSVVLTLFNNDISVSTHLLIHDGDAPDTVITEADSFCSSVVVKQGDDPLICLKSPSGVLNNVVPSASEGSGILVKDVLSGVGSGGQNLYLALQIADDAPTGKHVIGTSSTATEDFDISIEVQPSDEMPSFSLSPAAFFAGKRFVTFDLEAEGIALDDKFATILFDDPAILLESFVVTGPYSAQVKIQVAPTIKAKTVIAYLYNAGQKAAATVEVINRTINVGKLDVEPIERKSVEANILIPIETTNFDTSGLLVAQLFEDIGVSVVSISAHSEHGFNVRLAIDEGGPGGWFGLVVSNEKFEQVLVPLYIKGNPVDNDTLSLNLNFDRVTKGTFGNEFLATVPYQVGLTKSLVQVATDVDGVYGSVKSVFDDRTANILVDVAFDSESTADEVKVFLLAERGAAVGVLGIDEITQIKIEETSPSWSGVVTSEKPMLFSIVPWAEMPYILTMKTPLGSASQLSLLAQDNLVYQDTSDDGLIWFYDNNSNIAVTASDYAKSVEVSIDFIQKGLVDPVVQLSEPNDDLETAFDIGLLKTDPDDPDSEPLNLCEQPLFATEQFYTSLFDSDFDVDMVTIPPTDCDLVALIFARQRADRAWSVPDSAMLLMDFEGENVLARSVGWPTVNDKDPRIYLEKSQEKRQLVLRSELATGGTYFLNIRSAQLIMGVCRGSYIDLELKPYSSMNGWSVETIDLLSGDQVAFPLPEEGTVPQDGRVVLGEMDGDFMKLEESSGLSAMPRGTPFLVLLKYGDVVVDALQVGQGSIEDIDFGGEGAAVDDLDSTCYLRFGGLDTNNNAVDFVSQ